MPSSFEMFKKQLDDSVAAIELSNVVSNESTHLVYSSEQMVDTQSLLARCESLCKKYESSKPTIRVIHHLACSGGTLISKCLSAMPNVYLLSEVHPFTNLAINKGKPSYVPSDIATLTKYAGIPNQNDLAKKLFKSAIDEVYEHVTNLGGTLVLRDHTHADFTVNDIVPEKSTIISLLEDKYNIQSVLTIRNPIDSYTSLIKNGWLDANSQSFDEYCRRLLLLISQFKKSNVFKYEGFLTDPQIEMQAIAQALKLPFDSNFEDIFGIFEVTGDSGRTSDFIGERASQASDEIIEASKKSNNYKILSKKWL